MAKVRFGFRLGLGLWCHLREPSSRFGVAQPASPLFQSREGVDNREAVDLHLLIGLPLFFEVVGFQLAWNATRALPK